MEELDHIETQKKFDTLCGFKNYYVPYIVKDDGSIRPLHSFKDLEPSKAFTKQELLRGLCYGIRPNFNGIFIMDCDFKKDENASKLPEKFRNTYIDDTKGGEHLIYIVENGIPPYWKYSTGKSHNTPYGADLFCEKNIGCVMTNSFRNNKYYNNIKYMAPQIIPKELFNEIDDFMKKTHLNKTKTFKSKIQNEIVKKSFKSKSTSFKQLRKMLNLLPIKYFDNTNQWLKMCWIIHHETNGSQEGLELFEEMSRKVEEYKNADPNVYASQWKNANKANSKQLTIATLFKYLKDEGFEYKDILGHKKFNRNYFDKIKSDKDEEDMKKLKEEIKDIEKKIEETDDDDRIKATTKRKEIKKLNKKIVSLKEQINAIVEDMVNEEYKLKKKYFEEFNFKIINPFAYGVITEKELILYKKGDMISLYENLELGGEAGLFIGTWFKDKKNKVIDEVDFLPYGLKCPKDTYNLFNGFKIEKKNIELVDISNINIILQHIKNLGGGEENSYEYQLNYFAHLIQKPHCKPRVAIVYKSEKEGCGKNLLLEAFYKTILGKDYGMATADQEDIFRRFNTSYQKFMLIFDEARGKDSFMNSEKIKSRITCDDVYMEQKGFKGKMIMDFARPFFLTNNRTGVKVGLNDRRFVIFKCIDHFANDPKYFKPLAKALYDNNIMGTFYNFLKNRDISDFDPINDRPFTEEYKNMQSVNIPTIARFLCSYVDNEEFNKNFNQETHTDIIEKSSELFEKCNEWAIEKGFKATNQTAFGLDIKQFKGITKKRRRSGKVYIINLNKLKNYLIDKNYYETLEEYEEKNSDYHKKESKNEIVC